MIKLSSFLCLLVLISFSTELISTHNEEDVSIKEVAHKKQKVSDDKDFALMLEVSREPIFTSAEISKSEGELLDNLDTITHLKYSDKIKIYLRGLGQDSLEPNFVFTCLLEDHQYEFDLKTLLVQEMKVSLPQEFHITKKSSGVDYDPQADKLMVLAAEPYTICSDELHFKFR